MKKSKKVFVTLGVTAGILMGLAVEAYATLSSNIEAYAGSPTKPSYGRGIVNGCDSYTYYTGTLTISKSGQSVVYSDFSPWGVSGERSTSFHNAPANGSGALFQVTYHSADYIQYTSTSLTR